jgi:hypothetical protein
VLTIAAKKTPVRILPFRERRMFIFREQAEFSGTRRD